MVQRSKLEGEAESTGQGHGHGHGEDEDSDDEDEEGEQVAVMVPMADMLNAAYERDNARLFDQDDFETEGLGEVIPDLKPGFTMISTKEIKAGEQIVSASIPLAHHPTLSSTAALSLFAPFTPAHPSCSVSLCPLFTGEVNK